MNDRSGTRRQNGWLGTLWGNVLWFQVGTGHFSVDLSGRALLGAASKAAVTHLRVTSVGALSPDRQVWGWIDSWPGNFSKSPPTAMHGRQGSLHAGQACFGWSAFMTKDGKVVGSLP